MNNTTNSPLQVLRQHILQHQPKNQFQENDLGSSTRDYIKTEIIQRTTIHRRAVIEQLPTIEYKTPTAAIHNYNDNRVKNTSHNKGLKNSIKSKNHQPESTTNVESFQNASENSIAVTIRPSRSSTRSVNHQQRHSYPNRKSTERERNLHYNHMESRRVTGSKSFGRSLKPDHLDKVTFNELCIGISDHDFGVDVTCYLQDDNILCIQSNKTVPSSSACGGVSVGPLFLLKIHSDLTFESIHMGVQCLLRTLSRGRGKKSRGKLDRWSRVEEEVHILNGIENMRRSDGGGSIKGTGTRRKGSGREADGRGSVVRSRRYSVGAIVRGYEYLSMAKRLYEEEETAF